MIKLSQEEIAAMHTGKIRMVREGAPWSDEEKISLVTSYLSGIGITELAYIHERTENAIIQQLLLKNCFDYSVKKRKTNARRQICQCERCNLQCTSECPIMKEKMKMEVKDNVQ